MREEKKVECPKCGHGVSKKDNFCSKCGATLIEGLICQNCGENNNPDNRYCGKCGKQISTKLVCNSCGFPLGNNTK